MWWDVSVIRVTIISCFIPLILLITLLYFSWSSLIIVVLHYYSSLLYRKPLLSYGGWGSLAVFRFTSLPNFFINFFT